MEKANEEIKTNSKCNKECEVYSRIVGYFRPVQRWNKGKTEEWKFRTPFSEEKSMKHKFKNEKTGNEPNREKLTSVCESTTNI